MGIDYPHNSISGRAMKELSFFAWVLLAVVFCCRIGECKMNWRPRPDSSLFVFNDRDPALRTLHENSDDTINCHFLNDIVMLDSVRTLPLENELTEISIDYRRRLADTLLDSGCICITDTSFKSLDSDIRFGKTGRAPVIELFLFNGSIEMKNGAGNIEGDQITGAVVFKYSKYHVIPYSDDYIGQKFITYVDTLFISGTHDGGTRMISRNALPRLGKTTSSCFYVTANGRRVADRHRTNLPLISPDGSTVNHLFHHFTHMK